MLEVNWMGREGHMLGRRCNRTESNRVVCSSSFLCRHVECNGTQMLRPDFNQSLAIMSISAPSEPL